MSSVICPRCGGALIGDAAESEPACLNCGYVAYASGLTTQAADAELAKRPSLPIATAGDAQSGQALDPGAAAATDLRHLDG